MKIFLAVLFLAIGSSSLSQDTWVQRDSINGAPRSAASVFALNDDAFVLTGLDEFGFRRSMVKYDISQDDWDSSVSLGGTTGHELNRGSAVAFSASGYGYCGLGTGTAEYYGDFWKFDPVAGIWTQIADFGGGNRREAVAFAIDSFGYVGTGMSATGLKSDFWKYIPSSNSWIAITGFPGAARRDAVGFTMGGQGYVGTGAAASGYTTDFWAYYPLTDTWDQKTDFPGTPRRGAIGFGLFPSAFIALGEDNAFEYKKDVWEYNYFGDSWTARADFPAPERSQAVAVTIQGRAFAGSGYNGDFYDDWWEYTPILFVDEPLIPHIRLSPNPAIDQFNVRFLNPELLEGFRIYSADGKDISNEFSINIAGSVAQVTVNNSIDGICFVAATFKGGGVYVEKILLTQ